MSILGIGKLIDAYKAYRKVKPVADVLQREGTVDKLKSRKLWVTVIIAAIGALLAGIGLEADKAQPILDWLSTILMTYIGGQAVVDVTTAIMAKKNGTA